MEEGGGGGRRKIGLTLDIPVKSPFESDLCPKAGEGMATQSASWHENALVKGSARVDNGKTATDDINHAVVAFT